MHLVTYHLWFYWRAKIWSQMKITMHKNLHKLKIFTKPKWVCLCLFCVLFNLILMIHMVRYNKICRFCHLACGSASSWYNLHLSALPCCYLQDYYEVMRVWRVCVAFLVNLPLQIHLTWDPMKILRVIVWLDWSGGFLSQPLPPMIALNDIKFGLGILNLALRWWMTFHTCRVQHWWQSQRKWATQLMPLKASASSIFTLWVLQPSVNSQGIFFPPGLRSTSHFISNIRRGLIPEF